MRHPHLEFCIKFCSSYLQKVRAELEKFQRVTKMIRVMERLLYKERLNKLGLHSLLNAEICKGRGAEDRLVWIKNSHKYSSP